MRSPSMRKRTGFCSVESMLASHASLHDILAAIVRNLEDENPAIVSSVLLLDERGQRLVHGAAPSLPAAYVRVIDGLQIGPQAGT